MGEYNAIADVLDLINNSIQFQGMKEAKYVCLCDVPAYVYDCMRVYRMCRYVIYVKGSLLTTLALSFT